MKKLFILFTLCCLALTGCNAEKSETAIVEEVATETVSTEVVEEETTVIEETTEEEVTTEEATTEVVEEETTTEETTTEEATTEEAAKELATMSSKDYFAIVEPALLKYANSGTIEYSTNDMLNYKYFIYTATAFNYGEGSEFISNITIDILDPVDVDMLELYKYDLYTPREDGVSSYYYDEDGEHTLHATLGNVRVKIVAVDEAVFNNIINDVYTVLYDNMCYVDESDFRDLCK